VFAPNGANTRGDARLSLFLLEGVAISHAAVAKHGRR
jgi:hypothetical protein